MIIDELLDARDGGRKADLKYIKEEAEIFGFDYIAEAISDGGSRKIREALEKYIDEQNYSPALKRSLCWDVEFNGIIK